MKKKWCFLGQAFAGFGMHLNENWQLTAGYRLRFFPQNMKEDMLCVKLNTLHAAEVGLTYQF